MRPDDFQAFYGRDLPYTAKGWVAELDGKIIGIGGFALLGMPALAFSDMTEEMKAFPITIMRESKRIMAELAKTRSSAYCLASKEFPNSAQFLERLGWVWQRSDPNGEIYAWQSLS